MEGVRDMDVCRDVKACVMFKNAKETKSVWGVDRTRRNKLSINDTEVFVRKRQTLVSKLA